MVTCLMLFNDIFCYLIKKVLCILHYIRYNDPNQYLYFIFLLIDRNFDSSFESKIRVCPYLVYVLRLSFSIKGADACCLYLKTL